MAKGNRGGKGSSSGKSKGIGAMGTGIAITRNGKVTNYFVAGDGLREIRSARPLTSFKPTMSPQEIVKKYLENGNAKFLSKADVDKLRKQYQEDRANTPDYELGVGTPWGNRGASKRVYRPKRMKW